MNTFPSLKAYLAVHPIEGAKKAHLLEGPNGRIIAFTDAQGNGIKQADGRSKTIPLGKRSQNTPLEELKILVTDDGNPIATANEYNTVGEMSL